MQDLETRRLPIVFRGTAEGPECQANIKVVLDADCHLRLRPFKAIPISTKLKVHTPPNLLSHVRLVGTFNMQRRILNSKCHVETTSPRS